MWTPGCQGSGVAIFSPGQLWRLEDKLGRPHSEWPDAGHRQQEESVSGMLCASVRQRLVRFDDVASRIFKHANLVVIIKRSLHSSPPFLLLYTRARAVSIAEARRGGKRRGGRR